MSEESRALAVSSAQHLELPDESSWRTTTSMAKAFFESGLLPSGIKTPQAAALLIQKGRELRVPPTYALSNIHVIGGKPTCSAELMLSLIFRDHGDDALIPAKTTNEEATYHYKRRGWRHHSTFSFTIEDAQRAGLTTGNNAHNWQKYPGAMLRARAISAIARMAFPDSIAGMYLPDELGAEVAFNDQGEMIISPRDPEPAPEPRQQIDEAPADDEPMSEPEAVEADFYPSDEQLEKFARDEDPIDDKLRQSLVDLSNAYQARGGNARVVTKQVRSLTRSEENPGGSIVFTALNRRQGQLLESWLRAKIDQQTGAAKA